MVDETQDVTALLRAVGDDEAGASDRLLPLVYDELRKLAHARMRHEGPQTLQPTALVHEAYLRLVRGDPSWENRGHFFAAAAEAMRRILVERARRAGRLRHGGADERVSLDAEDVADPGAGPDDARGAELLAIDQALEKLEEHDVRMARVVKLRYFVGLSLEETAQSLGLTLRTVSRDWVAAKAWLRRAVGQNSGSDASS
ncbi:MAG: sigma-70 family RNA polymerase sigma factor [Xanthomonadales bacterium]|nr:sigma-70 family RNA polymerase sigma factor [Xanthomonadales bacterium]